ncbi:MAG TPA: hypothetical protein VFD32_13285 [Dehalococcoidia bacterium]|nr:hypothetical protein [Dehalococcoidia bacterium]
MSERQPLDFLIGRADHVARRAAELQRHNRERRDRSAHARRRAQIAVLKARLLSQYAANLCELSRTLKQQSAGAGKAVPWRDPRDVDELQRRRLERKLRRWYSRG